MKKFFGVFLLAMFSAVIFGCDGSDKNYVRIESEYPGDERMWDHIFEMGEEGSHEFESRPLGIILPHHLIAANEIAKFYRGLSKVTDPSMIVILGPNHYENGTANIQTCKNCLYPTVKGDVELDHDFIEELVDDGIAVYNDETFLEEHAIFSHTPFIKNYFPEAEIVPIILQWKIPINDVMELSDWLNENLPEDALVMASVDFSHYVPQEVAEFHDQTSFTTINNFDLKNVYNLELDSPSSIYALLDLMKRRGYGKVFRFGYTNLADFKSEHEEETTSHQYIAFFEGEIEPVEGLSIMTFGNMPADNIMTFLRGWEWDPNYDVKNDYTMTRLLRDIRGREDRFFVGSDFYVFDLPENDCLYEEKYGVKVSFCRLVEGVYDLKGYRSFIKEKKEDTDLLYLLFDFTDGGEIDYDRKLIIRDFAKRGVDIFVGRGLKEVIPFEIYRGSLVFYSLGDFAIDNKLATSISATSSGVSLGIYVTEDYYYVYTFPVEIDNGYPKLMDFSKRPSFFESFIEEASSKGIIKIRR